MNPKFANMTRSIHYLKIDLEGHFLKKVFVIFYQFWSNLGECEHCEKTNLSLNEV